MSAYSSNEAILSPKSPNTPCNTVQVEGVVPPDFHPLLTDTAEVTKLYALLSARRQKLNYCAANKPGALIENNPPEQTSLGLAVSPYTESFRRHILVGEHGLVEIKVPGDNGWRRSVFRTGFTLPNRFIDSYGETQMTKPLAYIQHPPSSFEAYGEQVRFPEDSGYPFCIMVYEFEPFTGCRIANLNREWIAFYCRSTPNITTKPLLLLIFGDSYLAMSLELISLDLEEKLEQVEVIYMWKISVFY